MKERTQWLNGADREASTGSGAGSRDGGVLAPRLRRRVDGRPDGRDGIASPSLYAAFGSKEALFRLALEHYSATEGREIWGGVEQAGSAHDAVRNYLMDTARVFTRRSKPAGCLIVLSALHPAERSDTVRQTLIAMRERTVEHLRERLRQGSRPARSRHKRTSMQSRGTT